MHKNMIFDLGKTWWGPQGLNILKRPQIFTLKEDRA